MSAKNAFMLSVIENTKKEPLTKLLSIDAEGKLIKTTGAQLIEGRVTQKILKSLSDLCQLMIDLPSTHAVTFGICPYKSALVLSQNRAAGYKGKEKMVTRTQANFSWAEGPGVLLLDYDPPPDSEAMDAADLVAALRRAVPELISVTIANKPSVSSCIYDDKGQCLSGIKGQHILLICKNAQNIPEVGELIAKRLWLAGYGYIRISASGNMLERTIIDTSVWQPERLVFGSAACKTGLLQRFPAPRIFSGELDDEVFEEEHWLDPSSLLPLTEHECEKLSQLKAQEKTAKSDEAEGKRKEWIEKRSAEAAGQNASPETVERHRKSFRLALSEGNVMPPELKLYSQDGIVVSAAEVFENPDKWDGKRFSDPFEPDYRDDQRIALAVLKNCAEPHIYSHAHGGMRYLFRTSEKRRAEAVAALLQPVAVEPWVQEMNAKYFVAVAAGKTVVCSDELNSSTQRFNLVTSSFEDIKNLLKNTTVLVGERRLPKGKAWTEHPQRRTYDGGIVFAPNMKVAPNQYNLWRGYGVIEKEGDWSLMKGHILNIICAGDAKKYDYVIGWLANAVQHPDRAGMVALVLQGGQGTGKGYFARYCGRLFGQHYLAIANAEHITGKFNGHLRDAVLVFADEAFFAGDKKAKNEMKSLITEKTFTLEDKYMKAQQVQNHMHFIFASNERHVVNVEYDDRRHCVLQINEKVKNNREYFATLEHEIKNGGPEAMLHDLQNYDLSSFDIFAVPQTKALLSQKLESLTGPTAWLYNCLSAGEIAGKDWMEQGVEIPRERVYESYVRNHRQYGEFRASRNESAFGVELKDVLGDALKTTRPAATGGSVGFDANSIRPRHYAFPSLSQARASFAKHLGHEIDWPSMEDDHNEPDDTDVMQ
jgi:hypothetical protein